MPQYAEPAVVAWEYLVHSKERAERLHALPQWTKEQCKGEDADSAQGKRPADQRQKARPGNPEISVLPR